jgi:hypothetical protein
MIEEAVVSASRSSRRSARLAACALFASFAALAALSACSAGQLAQTSEEVPSVPGANVNVGPSGVVSLRNMVVVYNGPQGYPQGGSAPLVVRIFNSGPTKLTLVKVSAGDAASSVLLVGGTAAQSITAPTATATPTVGPSINPSGSATPTTTASAAPTPTATKPAGQASFAIDVAPVSYTFLVPGQGPFLQLTGLTSPLIPGGSVVITFSFSDGTTGTAHVPVGVPQNPQPRQTPQSDVNEIPPKSQ